MPQAVQRAIVFANGEFDVEQFKFLLNQGGIQGNELIVCVDGGLRHCLDCNLQANLLIGDMDSASIEGSELKELSTAELIEHPPEKNKSDLHLCLQLLADRGVSDVLVFGHSGGRSDHMLFNWGLFASNEWPFSLRLIDASVDAYVVNATHSYIKLFKEATTFSVLALNDAASGVCVSGAKYPLENVVLSPGDTLGLSNEACEDKVCVSVKTGLLLVMVVRTASPIEK